MVESSKDVTSEPTLPRYKRPTRRIDEGDAQEFELCKDDLDLSRLKTQLLMLPDLIKQRCTNNSATTTKVTNVKTICEIIVEASVGAEMLSEVIKL